MNKEIKFDFHVYPLNTGIGGKKFNRGSYMENETVYFPCLPL